ncbi:hypothetical protein M0R45_010443 [Rubus argutus]|uniref:S-protein homolog n=1 Tax=Rubus argutus TaxID=59490 RepID=A0AAW1Y7Y2_RUBAR
MKPFMNISLLLLVIVICLSQPLVIHSILGKYTVHIINGFQNNEVLHAHCKSKDDDLGFREISMNEEFNWTFRRNIGDTTLFFCNMWWSGGHLVFNVYDAKDDTILTNCSYGGSRGECMWRMNEDGIYLYNMEYHEYHSMHKWGP